MASRGEGQWCKYKACIMPGYFLKPAFLSGTVPCNTTYLHQPSFDRNVDSLSVSTHYKPLPLRIFTPPLLLSPPPSTMSIFVERSQVLSVSFQPSNRSALSMHFVDCQIPLGPILFSSPPSPGNIALYIISSVARSRFSIRLTSS
jgi:hypothetical protein